MFRWNGWKYLDLEALQPHHVNNNVKEQFLLSNQPKTLQPFRGFLGKSIQVAHTSFENIFEAIGCSFLFMEYLLFRYQDK